MDVTKKPIYPVEPWVIRETEFKTENNYRNEVVFALSNGYIGTRGTYEEGYDFDIDTGLEGNFINGFYESEKIRYGEANFGSPEFSQSLLNLPNAKMLRITLAGEMFDMREGEISEYSRVLDMKAGRVERHLIWTSPKGQQTEITMRRLVSFGCKNLMEISCQVKPLNFSGSVTFESFLDAEVENHTRKTNPIVDYGPFGQRLDTVRLRAEETGLYYEGVTKGSHLTTACGCDHRLMAEGVEVETTRADCAETGNTASEKPVVVCAGICSGEDKAYVRFETNIEQGQEISLEKYIIYTSDLDMPEDKLDAFVSDQLAAAKERGFEAEAQRQQEFMDQFWQGADVMIHGDTALQQGIRFNLFHIMQAAGRDGHTGMGAKGLTGEGYEGHYFWDTEMYVLPFFIYTCPELAKKLLDYRYGTLDRARARARILGHEKGALYPWRTINGDEASTYYPLGTAQYHINGDIAYALCLYLDVTGDVEYLKNCGAEILFEIARVWADVGSFAECKGGKYCICSVTGPDEYNVLVDNNFYTNLLARENLRAALKAAEYLKENVPDTWSGLCDRLELEGDELSLWQKIADNMYFPYDETREIYPLDDGFMMRRPWDESRIPPEKRAWLYENYHPLFIMRHRMSKQADSMLGMYLYSNLFTDEEIRRNYDFYQEVTLHHSSLSTCIFGIVASQIGYGEDAHRYFSQSARMDLDDYHNNVYAGIHAANMAGTWQAIVNGFAGMRTNAGVLSFRPTLPEDWEGYAFRIGYRGRHLKVEIGKTGVTYTLEDGENLVLYSNGEEIRLKKKGERRHEEI